MKLGEKMVPKIFGDGSKSPGGKTRAPLRGV